MNNGIRGIAAIAALTTAALVPVLTPADARAQEREPGQPAARAELAEIISQTLPPWDESILQVPTEGGWTEQFVPESVIKAVDDEKLGQALSRAPLGATLAQSETSTLRFDIDEGVVRYVNRERAAHVFEQSPRPLPAEEDAKQLSVEALLALGLPERQLGEIHADTQMSGGGKPGATTPAPETLREVFRLLTIERQMNGYPVFMSGATVAVDADGQVQRLRVRWPSFALGKGDRLAQRKDVVERVVDVLIDQGTSSAAKLDARLGYVQLADDGASEFQPVVLVSADDAPSPFLFSVPVVTPGGGDD